MTSGSDPKILPPDILPHNLWDNVPMADTAAAFAPPNPTFDFDWKTVQRGVPISALEQFAVYSGFALKDLLEVVIPSRTLKHRRQRKEPLSLDESDRLARVARIYALAVKVFSDTVDGREWMTFPIDRFEGKTALEMLRTETGGRQVEEALIQIDEGMFV
jgi:putative toxin-antitoxin system antitoxin component (TIGR02293 family)